MNHRIAPITGCGKEFADAMRALVDENYRWSEHVNQSIKWMLGETG